MCRTTGTSTYVEQNACRFHLYCDTLEVGVDITFNWKLSKLHFYFRNLRSERDAKKQINKIS